MKAKPVKKRRGASLMALDKTKDSKFRDTQLKRRNTLKEKKGPKQESGVIYLGCIPHGFFETEMYEYFSQFGGVKKVLLVRSKKTGRSCGYGFVQFYWKEVAAVVANTMDGYLTFNRIMKCKLLERRQIPQGLFSKKNRVTKDEYPALMQRKRAIRKLNQPRTTVAEEKRLQRLQKSYRKKLKHLNSLGIRLDLFSNKRTRRGNAKTKPAVEAANPEVSDEKMEDSLGEQQRTDEEEQGVDIQDSAGEQHLADEELGDTQDIEMSDEEDSVQEEEMTEEYQEKLEDFKEELAAKIKLNLSKANIEPGSDGKLVLEVDESDDEIEFKTPPNAVKKFVRVSSSFKSPNQSTKSKAVESEDKMHLKTPPRVKNVKSEDKIQLKTPPSVKNFKGQDKIQLKTPPSLKNVKRKCDSVEDVEETPINTSMKKKKVAKAGNAGHEESPASVKMNSAKKPKTPSKLDTSESTPAPDSTPASKKTPKKKPNPKQTPTSTPKTPNSTRKTLTSAPKTPASANRTPSVTKKTPTSTLKTPTKQTSTSTPKTPTTATKSPKNYTKLSSKKNPALVKFPTPKKISKSPK